jgi:hypothetical protein
VQATVSVEKNDREVEFHMLKRNLRPWQDANRNGEYELGPMSCEQMAEIILEHLISLHPDRESYTVKVSEVGAVVEMLKP